jgi:hypothetical protein
MATSIKLKPLNIREIKFTIVGTSPLIQHAWSQKALRQLRMTAQERRKVPKVARDPDAEAAGAMYTIDDKPAFPLLALKASMINAAHKDLGIEKTLVKKSFFIPATNPERLIEMQCSEPIIREDIVRIGMSQTDIRYRPEFQEWKVNVTAHYDADNLNDGDIVNLVNRAGFGVGVGEWRPEKGGEFGRFVIDTTRPVETKQLEM